MTDRLHRAESERIATSNCNAAMYSDGYINPGINDTGEDTLEKEGWQYFAGWRFWCLRL